MKYIDLHTHTNFSDAEVSLEHSLAAAEELGLAVFSVTDHNTVAAYGDLARHRRLYSGKILPAVELSTVYNGEIIEIIGYGVDVSAMGVLIAKSYPSFYDKQVREAGMDVLALLKAGVTLDPEFVRKMVEEPQSIFDPSRCTNRPYLLREIKKHPENARFFASEEEFRTIGEGKFTRNYLFNAKSPIYSDQSSLCPSLSEVIAMIRECGGLAFLAHTFAYSENIVRALDGIVAYGLDGLECCYGTFTAEQKRFVSDYCDAHNLYKSGGSDYHGRVMRPDNVLGYSAGEKIPFSLIEPWFGKVENTLL